MESQKPARKTALGHIMTVLMSLKTVIIRKSPKHKCLKDLLRILFP